MGEKGREEGLQGEVQKQAPWVPEPQLFLGHQQLLTSVPPFQILPPPARFMGSMKPERSVESQ